MCEKCNDIILREKLYNTNDYFTCLDYIQHLLGTGDFEVDEDTEPAKKYTVTHVIKCKECGERYKFTADTFHKTGSFTKVE